MGKDDFMKLLIAQLQNQDPMKPTDDTQFIAQLAQFSSLEATNKMNDTLEELAGAQLLGQAASMIGKQVSAKLEDGTTVSGTVTAVHMIDSKPKVVVNGQEIDTSLINTVSTVTPAD
jgi:flagellar basal-body rod modification protein FlgD